MSRTPADGTTVTVRLSIGRYSYRTGFVARRSAEDLASFLALEDTVRDVALDHSRRPQG